MSSCTDMGLLSCAILKDSDDFTQESLSLSTCHASVIWCHASVIWCRPLGWLSSDQRPDQNVPFKCILVWRHGPLLCELVMQTRSFWSPFSGDTVSCVLCSVSGERWGAVWGEQSHGLREDERVTEAGSRVEQRFACGSSDQRRQDAS